MAALTGGCRAVLASHTQTNPGLCSGFVSCPSTTVQSAQGCATYTVEAPNCIYSPQCARRLSCGATVDVQEVHTRLSTKYLSYSANRRQPVSAPMAIRVSKAPGLWLLYKVLLRVIQICKAHSRCSISAPEILAPLWQEGRSPLLSCFNGWGKSVAWGSPQGQLRLSFPLNARRQVLTAFPPHLLFTRTRYRPWGCPPWVGLPGEEGVGAGEPTYQPDRELQEFYS